MHPLLLDIQEHTAPGYRTMVSFGAWRVALLNDQPRMKPGHIAYLERHTETDETFTLLKGNAALLIGHGRGPEAGFVEVIPLEPCKVYCVKRAVWHNIVMGDGATVLIAENADTGESNTERCDVTPDLLNFSAVTL